MDSVSDKALNSDAEIIIHAYSDGNAPDIDRMKKLGISNYKVLPVFGTSEDVTLVHREEFIKFYYRKQPLPKSY